MNFLRDIKIRSMVVLLLLISMMGWGGVCGVALWAFHLLNARETFSLQQQQWISLAEGLLMASLAASVAVAVVMERYLTRFLVKPLHLIREHMHVLADGDLQAKLPDMGNNCVGEVVPYVRRMQANWEKAVSEIRNSADHIRTDSGAVAGISSELSSRAEQQAAALEETSASMAQLSSTVGRNAESAAHASTLARNATQTATRGGESVKEVVKTMEVINQSSHKIVDITTVINSIAFQTNILALNAAVEAARAGEAGRGFAVVASEVRNLAQRSAQAAKEIEVLLTESANNIQTGSRQVKIAGEAMENILHAVEQVNDIMQEIASASGEQSQGIDQVGIAVREMDEVTQHNQTLVQQSVHSSTDLEQQAHTLYDIVARFRIAPINIASHRPGIAPDSVRTKLLSAQASLPSQSRSEPGWETF